MIKTFGKLSILIFIASFITISSFGQEDTSKSKTEPTKEKRRHGNYLQVINAKKMAIKYKKINKKLLSELMVIIGNFGESGEKSKYEELMQNYTEGVKDLYKRKYLESGERLKQNNKEIKVLYKTLTERYRNKASDLLSQCAEVIVERELSLSSSSDQSPDDKGKIQKSVHENNHRLTIGYDQFNMGTGFEKDENFTLAVIHFRGAIIQAINILIDMAETEEKKNEVRNKYKVDIYDVENRLATEGS